MSASPFPCPDSGDRCLCRCSKPASGPTGPYFVPVDPNPPVPLFEIEKIWGVATGKREVK